MKKLILLLLFFLNKINCVEQPTALNQWAKGFFGTIKSDMLDHNATSNSAMVEINKSGAYYLVNNLNPNPVNNNVTCIKVNASNVIINLNTFQIQHDTSGGGTNLTAIEVASNVFNVKITGKGRIRNINGTGIKVGAGSRGIFIEDTRIIGCSNVGIYMLGNSSSKISNFLIERSATIRCDGSTNATDGAAGMMLVNCENGIIKSSFFNLNQNTTNGNGQGVILFNCADCDFISSEASENSGNNGYGFRIQESSAIRFNLCEATRNTGVTTDAFGFALTGTATYSNVLTKCFTEETKGVNNAYGFYLESAQNTSFTNCNARGQNVTASTGSSRGFYSTAGRGNIFSECKAIGSRAGGGSSASIAAGFELRNSESYGIIENCYAISNNALNSGFAYGIKLGDAADTTTQITIRNNYIVGNTGAGKYGFKDFATNMSTLLYGNLIYGHRAGATSFSNAPSGGDTINESAAPANNLNYMYRFSGSGTKASAILSEASNASLNSLTTESLPFTNISIYPSQ